MYVVAMGARIGYGALCERGKRMTDLSRYGLAPMYPTTCNQESIETSAAVIVSSAIGR